MNINNIHGFSISRVRKVLNLRIFEGDAKRWHRSVKDEGLEILCVSQVCITINLLESNFTFTTFEDKGIIERDHERKSGGQIFPEGHR